MMIPESKLIRSEITLRDMSLPQETTLARKSLVRWLSLAMGLMAPNESRKLLLDVIEALVFFHVKKQMPTTAQIMEKIAELSGTVPNQKTVYYHLLNLKNRGFIQRKKGMYCFSAEEGKSLSKIVRELYEARMHAAFTTMEEAFEKLESSYR